MSSNNESVLVNMPQRNSDDLPGMSSDQKGLVLSFHNISYHVKEKRGFLFNQKTTEKRKLWNINGIMKPGLNAIMGPSGGDKSLLLDILAARKDLSGLRGDVWVHGVPEDASFQCTSGYVVRDDVVMATLTVRENLWFSAALRLPTTMTKQEKHERINKVIEELDLEKVADSKVESKELRKVTSMGMELILDPFILFLDEPTTGLDWRTSNDVVTLLKNTSEQRRIIIFTIHEPHYSIFQLFDSLTILASGKLMYHGPAQSALEHFESAGYFCDHHINPGEYFLGVIAGTIKRKSEDQEANNTEIPSKAQESVIETLADLYATSAICDKTKSELHRLSKNLNKRSLFRKKITYVTPFGHQLIAITWRSFRSLVGHPQPWIAEIITTFILGLLGGVTFLLMKDACIEIQIRAGVLFFLMLYQYLSSESAVKLFIVHNELFLQESISGYYRVSSYFLGNILPYLLSRKFLPSFIFTCTLYFMVGLKPAVEPFFIMIFTLMMVSLSSISMALAIGAIISKIHTGIRVMGTYFISAMILWGLTLYYGSMAPQFFGLQYFSIPYYGLTALQHNEFLGQNFCPAIGTTQSNNCSNYVICFGEEFLIMQDIDLSSWGLWKNHMALAILMIIFLIIAYLKLLVLKKNTLKFKLL